MNIFNDFKLLDLINLDEMMWEARSSIKDAEISESSSASDAFDGLIDGLAEDLTVNTSIDAIGQVTSEISDSISSSGLFDGLIDSVPENIGVNDEFSADSQLLVEIPDSVAVSDEFVAELAATDIDDSASAYDSFEAGLLLDSEISDSAAVTDEFAAVLPSSEVLADSAQVSASFDVSWIYRETIEESLSFEDTDDSLYTVILSITDSMLLSDVNMAGWLKEIIDTFFVYDAVKIGWGVTAESTLDIADSIETILGIIVDEWLTLIDTEKNNWSGQEIVNESVTLYDTITAIKTFSDTLTDTIDITDSSLFQLIVTILDVLGFDDLASAVRSSAVSVSESVELTDSSDLSLPVSATSELSLIDTSSVIASFIHSLQSDLGLADTSSLIARLTGSVTESISFAETVSNKGTYYSAVYDTIAMNVSISLNNEIWECYVLNTPKFYPSMYSGFDFNSFCIYEDRAFGANATGIFELTGVTDAGSEIHTGVIFSRTDFDMFNQKRFRKGYLDISGTTPKIILETDRDQRQAYTVDTDGKVTVSSELKSKTWKLSIADFDSLDGLSLIPIILTR
jgi:hypothetical protein